jgi:hypothetical protein
MVNVSLKIKLLRKGISQLETARMVGIGEGHLSKIVHGWGPCPDDLRERIAEALGSESSEIFPSNQSG